MKFIEKCSISALITAMILFLSFNLAEAQETNQNQSQNDQQQESGDVIKLLKDSGIHSTFLKLLEEAELTNILKQEGPFTVIAPNDNAFKNMEFDFDRLREDRERIRDLVMVHILQGHIPSENVAETLDIEIAEGDKEVSNGVVHFVDEVIVNNLK